MIGLRCRTYFLGPKTCLKPPARNGVDPDDWVDPRFGHEFIQPQPVEAKELPGMTFVLATKEEFPVLNNRNDLGTQEHIIISFKVLCITNVENHLSIYCRPVWQSMWMCNFPQLSIHPILVTLCACVGYTWLLHRSQVLIRKKLLELQAEDDWARKKLLPWPCLGQSPAFGEATKSQLVSRIIFEHIGDEIDDGHQTKNMYIALYCTYTRTHTQIYGG